MLVRVLGAGREVPRRPRGRRRRFRRRLAGVLEGALVGCERRLRKSIRLRKTRGRLLRLERSPVRLAVVDELGFVARHGAL